MQTENDRLANLLGGQGPNVNGESFRRGDKNGKNGKNGKNESKFVKQLIAGASRYSGKSSADNCSSVE